MLKILKNSWALFTGYFVLMIAHGFQGNLLGVRSVIEEFNFLATGAMMSGYFVGYFVGANSIPKIVGKVGHNIEIKEAVAAARACGLAIIAQLNDATNSDLDKISRIVKLGGFVNCTDTFTQQPEIINGASNLMVEVFGEAGRADEGARGVRDPEVT